MGKIKKNIKWAETVARAVFHQSPTSPDRPSPIQRLGMAPADSGAGLAKTRPQANPLDWRKPARR